MSIIESNLNEIKRLCRNHKVEKMYVFGSALKKSFQPDSDIDLLVAFEEFDLAEYLDNYLDLKLSLENLFKRKVDLVEVQTLKNPVLIRSIDRNKEQIYG